MNKKKKDHRKKLLLKPLRAVYTPRWSDLHDIYRGNTNHWSVMRVEGERSVMKSKIKDREIHGIVTKPPITVPGCTMPSYVWSKENGQKLRGDLNFSELCLQTLGGLIPGDLSIDNHKNYNKAHIKWPTNIHRTSALEGTKYWPTLDRKKCLSKPPKMAWSYHVWNAIKKYEPTPKDD